MIRTDHATPAGNGLFLGHSAWHFASARQVGACRASTERAEHDPAAQAFAITLAVGLAALGLVLSFCC